MRVNTEIYGESSTWRRDADGFSSSSNVPINLQFKRGQYDTLQNYVSQSRIEQGKPIDYSICYAGQAEGMPLSSLRTWNSEYKNGGWVATSYKRNIPTGWFFGHHINGIDSSTTQLVCSHDILANRNSSDVKTRYWLPDGTAQNYPNQPSQRMIPIVSFPPRGCYFGVHTRIFSPSTGQTQYKWLDELKSGDWSSWKILSAWGELMTYRNSDTDYSYVPDGSSHFCCICSNTELEFTPETTGSNTLPVLNYVQYIYGSRIPIFGWINNEWSVIRVDGVYHCMQRVFDTTTVTSSTAPLFIDTVPNATFNIVPYSSWGQGFEGYCDINAENLEAIRKATAAYGLFFTEQNPNNFASNANRWTNNNMFCGILDDSGIGHGNYTRGAENANNKVYGWESSQESPYGNPVSRFNIYLGDLLIDKIYLGDLEINKAYLGELPL